MEEETMRTEWNSNKFSPLSFKMKSNVFGQVTKSTQGPEAENLKEDSGKSRFSCRPNSCHMPIKKINKEAKRFVINEILCTDLLSVKVKWLLLHSVLQIL